MSEPEIRSIADLTQQIEVLVQEHRCAASPDGEEIVDACIWALAPGPLNLANGLKPLRYSLNSEEILRVLRPAFYEEPEINKVVAAMAVESDIRMQVQRGAFTVHGSRTPLERMEGRERWLRKFRIPADAVPGTIPRVYS